MSPQESRDNTVKQANDALARIDFLLANEHVAWFFREVVNPRVEQERTDALNVKRSKDDRDVSAHRHDALIAVANWLTEQRAMLKQIVDNNKS